MYCNKCGKELNDNAQFCEHCGTKVIKENNTETNTPIKREEPKCTHCGYVGKWEIGPILRPIDYVIGIIFLIFGVVPGLIYIGVVAAIRSNEDNREKICPKCKAKNLWTFFY